MFLGTAPARLMLLCGSSSRILLCFCVSVANTLILLTLCAEIRRPPSLYDAFDSGATDEALFAEAIVHTEAVTIFFVRVSPGRTILAAQHFSNSDDESRESLLRHR